MSQYSDTRPGSDPHSEPQSLNTSIFSASSDNSQTQKKSSVSNLTKNLMSSSFNQQSMTPQAAASSSNHNFPRQPPSYSASVTPQTNHHYFPNSFSSQTESQFANSHSTSSSFNQNPSSHFVPNSTSSYTPANYIPLGHNAPNAVSSSYTSNISFTPSFSQQFPQPGDPSFQQSYPQGPFAAPYRIPTVPTTNISMDSANSQINNQGHLSSFTNPSTNAFQKLPHTQPHSLPNSFAGSSAMQGISSMQRLPSDRSALPENVEMDEYQNSHYPHYQQQQHHQQHNQQQQQQNQVQSQAQGASTNIPNAPSHEISNTADQASIRPDHYMTYSEYLEILKTRDEAARENPDSESGYEERLNIVEHPVEDLITMLACLLTKIIEANDKLHPNHFENTIAVRQKLKDQKKQKKMERESDIVRDSVSFSSSDGVNTTVAHIEEDDNSDETSDDEDDELKNRYLANVLAFHGTNVPGITLHAYLTRALKYCPVTNDVFLSLLVYFDRIAKRANNLQKKKKSSSEEDSAESEQLFVMDSYNIHRLIISGITVSSKFISDIFYKNLRYAKVGGLPLEELNYLELQFLLLLDFKLMISVEDLQNYGDLLLKFWKREQLTSEIFNREGKGVEEQMQQEPKH